MRGKVKHQGTVAAGSPAYGSGLRDRSADFERPWKLISIAALAVPYELPFPGTIEVVDNLRAAYMPGLAARAPRLGSHTQRGWVRMPTGCSWVASRR
jgi:hypothetical protein